MTTIAKLPGMRERTITLNGRLDGVFSAVNHVPLPETSAQLLARAESVRDASWTIAMQAGRRSTRPCRSGISELVATTRSQLEHVAVVFETHRGTTCRPSRIIKITRRPLVGYRVIRRYQVPKGTLGALLSEGEGFEPKDREPLEGRTSLRTST